MPSSGIELKLQKARRRPANLAGLGLLKLTEHVLLQITIKAGSCREQYKSLNAECATVKQGLANLGLNSQTVEQKSDSLSGSQGAGNDISASASIPF